MKRKIPFKELPREMQREMREAVWMVPPFGSCKLVDATVVVEQKQLCEACERKTGKPHRKSGMILCARCAAFNERDAR